MSEDIGGGGHAQAPIIIKRKYAEKHAHHGGAWKMAYADMVTALMALFIVLWILARSDEFKANVAHYFQDPIGFSEGGTPTPFPGGTRSGEPAVLDEVQPRIPPPQQNRKLTWHSQAREIRHALEKLPSFDKYRDQIQLAHTQEGLRINLLESNETPLFKVGQAGPGPRRDHYPLAGALVPSLQQPGEKSRLARHRRARTRSRMVRKSLGTSQRSRTSWK